MDEEVSTLQNNNFSFFSLEEKWLNIEFITYRFIIGLFVSACLEKYFHK
jgi:hypothetical protein